VWGYFTAAPTSNVRMLACGHSDSDTPGGFQIRFDSSFAKYICDLRAASGSYSSATVTSPSISLNTWHMFAMTYDGTTTTAYIDGSSVATATGASGTATAENALSLGYNLAYNGDYFNTGTELTEASLHPSTFSAAFINSLWRIGTTAAVVDMIPTAHVPQRQVAVMAPVS
jgi:hypothetical protein